MAFDGPPTRPHRFESHSANRLNRHELESRVVAWAWKDPGYRRKLLENPIPMIAEETRGALDPSKVVRVIEERSGKLCLVLPAPPNHAATLTDEELLRWAAGERDNPYLAGDRKPESDTPKTL